MYAILTAIASLWTKKYNKVEQLHYYNKLSLKTNNKAIDECMITK